VLYTSITCNHVHIDPDVALFHARLGHGSMSKLKSIDACKAPDVDVSHGGTRLLSKFHRLPFQRRESIVENSFDLVDMGLWVPYKIANIDGGHYFLIVLDDSTCVIWTSLLQNKLQVVIQI